MSVYRPYIIKMKKYGIGRPPDKDRKPAIFPISQKQAFTEGGK